MKTQNDNASTYSLDGFVIIRGLYTPEEIALWCSELQGLIERSETSRNGLYVWYADTISPFFREQFCAPRIVDIAKSILGPRIEFLSAKPVVKSTSIRFASPWHQDRAYWRGAHKMSAWIAMDHVTPDNGCLQVIRGGHRALVDHQQLDADEGFVNRLGKDQLPDGERVDCVLEPGDAIFFTTSCPIVPTRMCRVSGVGASSPPTGRRMYPTPRRLGPRRLRSELASP